MQRERAETGVYAKVRDAMRNAAKQHFFAYRGTLSDFWRPITDGVGRSSERLVEVSFRDLLRRWLGGDLRMVEPRVLARVDTPVARV